MLKSYTTGEPVTPREAARNILEALGDQAKVGDWADVRPYSGVVDAMATYRDIDRIWAWVRRGQVRISFRKRRIE